MKKRIANGSVLSFLFLASVFVLALNKISDTDAWMHLTLGRMEWLYRSASIPEFAYASFGKTYYNYSWLFSLLYYLMYRALGLYGVTLLKAATVLAVFSILLKDSLRPYRNAVVSVAVLTAVVMMSRDRFVERPDSVLMLFLAFSAFSLNAYVRDNKKYLYLLPVMHIVWANMHSSVVVMVVPFLAYLAGGVAQRLFGGRLGIADVAPTFRQLGVIAVVFGLSAAATLIKPDMFSHSTGSTLSQFTAGAGVLSSGWWKQEIVELMPPKWPFVKWPFVMTPVVILSFLLNRKRFSFADLLIIAPFGVLQFTAIRFIFLFGIVAGPVLARNLSAFAAARSWERFCSSRAVVAAVVLCVTAYTGLAVAQVPPFRDRMQEFGFGINYANVPEGTLRYMDSRDITGRVFNWFDWGGYISWRDFPKRTVFVDPRGQLTRDLLEQLKLAESRDYVLDGLEAKYGFGSCLVRYPLPSPDGDELIRARPGYDLALSHPGWALVYWDDKSLLYLKKGGRYDAVIRRDEYRFIKPADGLLGVSLQMSDPNYAQNVLPELQRNIRETGSSRAYTLMGGVLTSLTRYEEAAAAYKKALQSPFPPPEAYGGLAYVYLATGRYDDAIAYCKESPGLTSEGGLLSMMGYAYMGKKEPGKAAEFFEKALATGPGWADLYPALINAYKELGMTDKASDAEGRYQKARLTAEGERHFTEGIRAYSSGQSVAAIREFEKSIELDPAVPSAYSNLGYLYLDLGDYGKALWYQTKALQVDPSFANAYYGLAMVYKRQGRTDLARRYWGEYLKREPKGYYSRLASAELAALGR